MSHRLQDIWQKKIQKVIMVIFVFFVIIHCKKACIKTTLGPTANRGRFNMCSIPNDRGIALRSFGAVQTTAKQVQMTAINTCPNNR